MGRVPDEIARRVKGGVEEDRFPSGQYAAQPKADVGTMYSDYLAEVTPAGKTVWEWRTWEHLDPVEDGITEVQAPRTLWAQGNGVLELPDGDLLTSYRPTSTVLRISRKTGKIVWKLGAPTVSGQHGTRAPDISGWPPRGRSRDRRTERRWSYYSSRFRHSNGYRRRQKRSHAPSIPDSTCVSR